MQNNIEIINRIYDHIENGCTDKAVFACLRLSRNIDDVVNTIVFMRELYPDKKQLDVAFYDETNHLNEEVQKNIWKITGDRWIDERTMRFSMIEEEPDKTVLALGVGEMQKEQIHIKETISDLNVPKGMGEYDAAAFTDRYDATKQQLRLRLSAINTIQERIRTRCLNYASRIEKQIQNTEKPTLFLSDTQNIVNNYFSAHSEDTYRKLQKAASLVGSSNVEDGALLLTSVRRAINSVSDYFYPPTNSKVICSDGVERTMGKEQYLNRLHEYCSVTFKSSTSNELIQAEIGYLTAFARKLNDIASKGVHAEVSTAEAKQGLVGLYMFLFNIINKLEENKA